MELTKLRELVAFLREAGVSHYADKEITLELVFDEVEEEVPPPEEPAPMVRNLPEPDPAMVKMKSVIPPEYQKAFDIKIRERKGQ